MSPERFAPGQPQPQHMPLGQQVLAPEGARRPHGRSDCAAPTRHSATGGAGGRAIDRSGQIEAPQALTAHWGVKPPAPTAVGLPGFKGGRVPKEQGRVPRDRPQRSFGRRRKRVTRAQPGPLDIGALAPKYLVGRPARKAKYAVPARSFQLRAAKRAEKKRLSTLSNIVHIMFPPAELSTETTKESVLNDTVQNLNVPGCHLH